MPVRNMGAAWMPGDGSLSQFIEEHEYSPRRALRKQREKEESNTWRTTQWGNYNKSLYIGLDPGKKSDYSALIFLEPFLPIDPEQHQGKFVYHLSRIQRLPLETPYPKIARLLRKAYNQAKANPDWDFIYIAIDEGGVGTAVADQIVELIPNADITRVTLTGGLRPKWNDARNVSLPKPQLASTLIALFESRRIWVAHEDKKQLEELKEELETYQMKINTQGHDLYGALKTGAHDDLASAIGIAAWLAEDSNGGSVPLFW
jgi:hypothetical protein